MGARWKRGNNFEAHNICIIAYFVIMSTRENRQNQAVSYHDHYSIKPVFFLIRCDLTEFFSFIYLFFLPKTNTAMCGFLILV